MDYSYASPIKPWKPFGGGAQTTGASRKSPQQLAQQQSPQSAVPQKSAGKSSAASNFLKSIEIGLLPQSLNINSEIYRNYFEMQLRDVGNTGGLNMIPASFREDFFWNRSLDTQWKLTSNLNMQFHTGTNARIEAPHVQVNKLFNPDEYTIWKDSVMQSIRDLGTPLEYKQTMNLTYQLPFAKIPILTFIKGSLSFNTTYDWARGATLEDETINIGNTITSTRQFGLDNLTFSLVDLYAKVPFLKAVDDKFNKFTLNPNAANNRQNARNQRQNRQNRQNANAPAQNANQKKTVARKKYSATVTLSPDSATVITHNLKTKRFTVTGKTETGGRRMEIKYKTIDENTIEIKNRDSIEVEITVSEKPPIDDERWYKIAQVAARGLMTVRSFGITLKNNSDIMVPGFDPMVGDFIGQGSTPSGLAPGVDFAFGFAGESYLEKAERNGWLIKNQDNITPAMFNKIETLSLTAKLEPLPGLKIDLSASRNSTNRNEVYFMYDGMPRKITGDFKMTTIGLATAFESPSASNGYHSDAFETFLSNRSVIAARLESLYGRSTYPTIGFLEGNYFAGQPYDPSLGAVDHNSTDVLIPAFIAAYTGKSAAKTGLSAFPSITSLLPNWKLSYDGLMRIPFFYNKFKNFSIDHTYSCTYSVGAFNSYLNWIESDIDGIGFIENQLNGYPSPSSPYDITTVSIIEAFNPFIALKSTLQNDMSLSLSYITNRTVNLNMAAYQIVETKDNKFALETGYRIDNFNRILKIKKTGGSGFNNELNIKATIAYTLMHNLIRKIEENLTQATNGNSMTTLKFSADYNLSRMITLQAFYDRQITRPLVSATAYPISKSSFGINIKVSLKR
jgi:cell surface protein SprA